MSSLVEIEQAIDRLPESEVDLLAQWLQRRRKPHNPPPASSTEPDFLERARRIWGEHPPGASMGELISCSRD
jgi:hypothetical protein